MGKGDGRGVALPVGLKGGEQVGVLVEQEEQPREQHEHEHVAAGRQGNGGWRGMWDDTEQSRRTDGVGETTVCKQLIGSGMRANP